MIDATYPKPDRSDFTPRLEEQEGNDVIDTGWYEGTFSDGRPYRVEGWRQGEFMMLTCFFSTMDINYFDRQDLRCYLEEEDIVRFTSDVQLVAVRKIKDPSGSELWSVNVVVADANASYVDQKIELHPYGEEQPAR